jgi:hypothetical protein
MFAVLGWLSPLHFSLRLLPIIASRISRPSPRVARLLTWRENHNKTK